MGDELYVIVSRDRNVQHKPSPILPEAQRLLMVRSLKPVDHAVLGSLADYFEPIESIRPDIIVLGHDQHFDEQELKDALKKRGFTPKIIRLPLKDEDFCSSRTIVSEIMKRQKNK